MEKLRKTIKSHTVFWPWLLTLVLICNQGATLHVHSLGHHHQQGHESTSPVDAAGQGQHEHHEHKGVALAHLATDDSHADHHRQVLSETDVTPDSVLIELSGKLILLALLLVCLLPLLFGSHPRPMHYMTTRWLWRPHLVPPLRAPPVFSPL